MGSGGTDAGEGDPEPSVVCDPLPPACPEMRHEGDLDGLTEEEATAWVGLTHLEGSLDFDDDYEGDFSEFDCLESVSGDFEYWGTKATFLGSFPRLREAGYTNVYTSVDVSCSLRSLEVTSTLFYSLGARGEIDLRTLTRGNVVIDRTVVQHVWLPRSLPGQLSIRDNSQLSEVFGLEAWTNGEDDASYWLGGTVRSFSITDNPLLSQCRAEELAQPLRDIGYEPDKVVTEGNGPCE
jgi:hypothetical protein